MNSLTDTLITCTVGPNSAGSYPLIVRVNNKGLASNNFSFEYQLKLTSLSNTEGIDIWCLNCLFNYLI